MPNRARSIAAFALAALFVPPLAGAHPGVGIVVDSRGNVFYTDLKNVWRVAPDGGRSIAVANVHSHELYLDAADNLYGEHLWYDGEKSNRWGHRVWRRSPDGQVTDIIKARPTGFSVDQRQACCAYASRPGRTIQGRTGAR